MALLTCYNNLTSEKKCLVKWTVQLYIHLDIYLNMILKLIFGSIICLNSDKNFHVLNANMALIYRKKKAKGRKGKKRTIQWPSTLNKKSGNKQ